MKHVKSSLVVGKTEFYDASLRLTLHYGVDRVERRSKRCAMIVIVEEITVQME